ncbi:hypothetical protein Tco_0494321 [Tanacetum coccineum]
MCNLCTYVSRQQSLIPKVGQPMEVGLDCSPQFPGSGGDALLSLIHTRIPAGNRCSGGVMWQNTQLAGLQDADIDGVCGAPPPGLVHAILVVQKRPLHISSVVSSSNVIDPERGRSILQSPFQSVGVVTSMLHVVYAPRILLSGCVRNSWHIAPVIGVCRCEASTRVRVLVPPMGFLYLSFRSTKYLGVSRLRVDMVSSMGDSVVLGIGQHNPGVGCAWLVPLGPLGSIESRGWWVYLALVRKGNSFRFRDCASTFHRDSISHRLPKDLSRQQRNVK